MLIMRTVWFICLMDICIFLQTRNIFLNLWSISCINELHFLFFFYIHKMKILDSRKLSTSGFRWIYIFWDVLILTIWPFLKNVCLSVYMSPKFCGHCISRTNVKKLMKLYIQLHLDIIWNWLDFSAYSSKNSNSSRTSQAIYTKI